MSATPRKVYSERKRFDAALMAELRPLLEGTPWRKAQDTLFTQTGDYFQQVQVCVDYSAPKTTIEWSIKPMAVDPILWAIDDCDECTRAPLSFRSSGITTCKSLRILDAVVEEPGDTPVAVARNIVELCQSRLGAFRELTDVAPFSQLIAGYRARPDTPWLGPDVAIALISEGKFEQARELALDYSRRAREAKDPLSRGRTGLDALVAWLDSGGPARLGLASR